MEELYELMHVLRTVMRYDMEDWTYISSKCGEKEAEMLKVMLSTPKLTNEKLATCISVDYTSGKFRRYKRELKKCLYNQLLLYPVNDSSHTSFQKNYYSSNQQLALIGVLKGLTLNALSKSIADNLIIKARKYFFNEIRLEVCRYLVKYYTIIEVDISKATDYYEESQECIKLISLENEIHWKYSLFAGARIKANSKAQSLHEMGLQFIRESEGHLSDMSGSFKFQVNYYSLGFLTYQVIGDYKNALGYAESAYEYFKSLSFAHTYAESGQLMKMAKCHLYLGDLEKAKNILAIAVDGYREGSLNWFICSHDQVLISIHLKEYSKAYASYITLKGHRNFKSLPEESRTSYLLVGAYLEFLLRVGMIESAIVPQKFPIRRFINQMSFFETDKERMKIPIIVAQLLFNIYDRDYDGMEQKIYVLKDFCSRNLVRKSPNFRSNCFIKMLLEVPINNFNAIAVERKTKKYLEKMQSISYNIAAPLDGVEVIPYEDLWAIILSHLEAPKRKRIAGLEKSMFVIN